MATNNYNNGMFSYTWAVVSVKDLWREGDIEAGLLNSYSVPIVRVFIFSCTDQFFSQGSLPYFFVNMVASNAAFSSKLFHIYFFMLFMPRLIFSDIKKISYSISPCMKISGCKNVKYENFGCENFSNYGNWKLSMCMYHFMGHIVFELCMKKERRK